MAGPAVRVKTLWIKPEYLQLILTGQKTVEVRVAYPNIARLEVGDTLLLNGSHPFRIVQVDRFDSFQALLTAEDAGRIAPGLSVDELRSALSQLYPPDKVALGVVALHLEPVCGAGSDPV